MPWQGFFELICRSDVFVFLDDFQFSVQSYHQRNRLFVNTGQVGWYNVAVEKSSFKMPMNKAVINEQIPWRTKLAKRMQLNYSRAPHYSIIFPGLENWLLEKKSSLAEQNIDLIIKICGFLGLKTEFRRSSEFHSESKRSARVLELLHWCNASTYYCARGSFQYMKEDGIFPLPDIVVLFQNFIPKPYEQVGSPGHFIPFLSIVDALMNVGPEKTAELVRTGTTRWDTWEEMVQSATIE